MAARKKKRTPAQIRATKKLVALNKKKAKKKRGKKKAKKKAKKKVAKKARKKASRKCPPARKKKAKKKVTRKTTKKTVARRTMADGSKWRLSATSGEWIAVSGPKKKRGKKKASRKTSKASKKKLSGRSVTLKDIHMVPHPKNLTAKWICAGPKFTGCGGGKKRLQGSRVVGYL